MSSPLAKWNNKIICSDCMEFMRWLPDDCVDLVFTSPPYADVKNMNTRME